jgi:hypothetical protein
MVDDDGGDLVDGSGMTPQRARPAQPVPLAEAASRRLWTAVSVGQLAWGALLVGAWLSLVWPSRMDPDYTSGEILDNTIAWAELGRLYGPIDQMPHRVFNYPPAFPAAVRALMAAGIAPLLAGRLLTLASIVLVLLLVYRWLRVIGCDRTVTALVVSLFASSFPLVYFVGQFHLQWAAVGLSLVGCSLLREPVSGARAAAAGLALALACLFKQTQVVSLVVMGTWLLVYHRRAVPAYAATAAMVSALGAAVVFGFFGREAWLHLVTYTVGTFSFDHLVLSLRKHGAAWTAPFLFGVWIAARDPAGRRDARFWYFAGSSLWLLSTARAGAGPGYFIEWSCATMLWIGPSLQEFSQTPRRRAWIAAALVAQLAASDAIAATKLLDQVNRLRRTERVLPELCAALPVAPPTPIESPGIARACGRTPALHPFIMTNLARRGLWDDHAFVRDIARGAFPVVVLPFDFSDGTFHRAERWTPAMLLAVRDHYRLAERHGAWRVFRPARVAGAE